MSIELFEPSYCFRSTSPPFSLLVEIVSLEADMAVMEVFGFHIKDLQGIGRIIKNRIILKEVK